MSNKLAQKPPQRKNWKHTPLRTQMFLLMMDRPRYCCMNSPAHQENKNGKRKV